MIEMAPDSVKRRKEKAERRPFHRSRLSTQQIKAVPASAGLIVAMRGGYAIACQPTTAIDEDWREAEPNHPTTPLYVGEEA
jgi:hypothetical protein